MARKRKGIKKPGFLTRYLKIAIGGIFITAVLLVTVNRLFLFIRGADFFKVKEVVLAPSLQFIDSRHLRGLAGRSMFDLDLAEVRSRLQSRYPQIDRLKVVRKFPDRIYILARKREPFAILASDNQDILLDKEGVVLSLGQRPDTRLPVLTGASKVRELVLGRPIRDHNVTVGLTIIRAINDREGLRSRGLASVDLATLSKIYVVFEDGLNVIMDADQIHSKIQKLAIVLSQGNLDFKKVQYVDLRFKEPILGQR